MPLNSRKILYSQNETLSLLDLALKIKMLNVPVILQIMHSFGVENYMAIYFCMSVYLFSYTHL